jgi:hypothetical protein
MLVRPGAAAGGSTRVSFTWDDGILRNRWLQVTVKANRNTGLASADAFSFGSLAGDAGGDALTVDGGEALATRSALFGGPVSAASPFDHNRDGRVDVRDLAAVRENQGASLVRAGQPAVGPPGAPAAKNRTKTSGGPPPTE